MKLIAESFVIGDPYNCLITDQWCSSGDLDNICKTIIPHLKGKTTITKRENSNTIQKGPKI